MRCIVILENSNIVIDLLLIALLFLSFLFSWYRVKYKILKKRELSFYIVTH